MRINPAKDVFLRVHVSQHYSAVSMFRSRFHEVQLMTFLLGKALIFPLSVMGH